MAYEFKNIGAVEALAEVPENANALVEVNGALKRVPGGALGGGAASGDEWDIIIRQDVDSGNYIWEKGDQDLLVEKLLNAEQPKAYLYYTNNNYEQPNAGFYRFDSIDISSGSGTWVYLCAANKTLSFSYPGGELQ